jgi:dihydropteroate synthase
MTEARSAKLVAILNLTPDSFSDGHLHASPNGALDRAEALLSAGADILDVGAESTRPGARQLSPQEEIQRLEPFLPSLVALCTQRGAQLSIDTYHAATAAYALKRGVTIVNDVSGGQDEEIWQLVKHHNATLIVMHSLSLPADPNLVLSGDPFPHLLSWIELVKDRATKFNVPSCNVIIDPGLGFGKSSEQSWQIVRNISQLCGHGFDVLVGHSRKSFLTQITGKPAQERDLETALVSLLLAQQGVHYIRVHNIDHNRAALKVLTQFNYSQQC